MINEGKGFERYFYRGVPIILDEKLKADEYKLFSLNFNEIRYKAPPPDKRSKLRKFIDEWKKRFENAWDALKGHDFD